MAADKDPEYDVGDSIHLGFGARGGAGFEGEITHKDDRHYHIKSKYDSKRTFKGPKKFATLVSKKPTVSQHSEQPASYLEHLKQGGLPHTYKGPSSDQ